MKRILVLAVAASALVACAQGAIESNTVQIEGHLTHEGIECPAMRGADGTFYTLTGDLGGFMPRDRVCVVGTPVEVSICQQGSTIAIVGISAAPCP